MPSSWLANGKNARGNASTQPRPNTNTSNDCEMRPTITPTARSPGVTCSSCEEIAREWPGAGGLVRVSLVDMACGAVCSESWTGGAACTWGRTTQAGLRDTTPMLDQNGVAAVNEAAGSIGRIE